MNEIETCRESLKFVRQKQEELVIRNSELKAIFVHVSPNSE